MHLMSKRTFPTLPKAVNTPNPRELALHEASLKRDRRCCAGVCLFNFSFRQWDAPTFFPLFLCKHCVALIISTESSKNNNLWRWGWPRAMCSPGNKRSFILQPSLNPSVYITRFSPRGGVGRAGIFLQHLKVMSVLKSLGISSINCGIAAGVYAPEGGRCRGFVAAGVRQKNGLGLGVFSCFLQVS